MYGTPVKAYNTLGFARCWKWPKLFRFRRAFGKAAFLTLCLCPPCFCFWADCKRLVPTLHCLIIILISMLPWMCIAEQNLAPPQCESEEEPWNTQSEQRAGRPHKRGHLWVDIASSPFSPCCEGERQRWIFTLNWEPCVLSAFSLAAPEISVVCGFLLHSPINPKCPEPA